MRTLNQLSILFQGPAAAREGGGDGRRQDKGLSAGLEGGGRKEEIELPGLFGFGFGWSGWVGG